MPGTPTGAGPHLLGLLQGRTLSNPRIASPNAPAHIGTFPVSSGHATEECPRHNSSGSGCGKRLAGGQFHTMSDIRQLYHFVDGGLKGTGGFGRVVRATRIGDGVAVALKVVGKQHGSRAELVRETIAREVETLRSLSHPSIIALGAAIDTQHAYYLEFDLCEEDIFMRMKLSTRAPVPFREADAATIIRQLADALSFLHMRRIAHLDVKLENILINSPSDVRLADFGFARQLSDVEYPQLVTNGSGLYTPPEVLRAQLATEGVSGISGMTLSGGNGPAMTSGRLPLSGGEVHAANKDVMSMDMWCLGVVTYLLIAGRPPYRTRVVSRGDREDMLRKIAAPLDFQSPRWESIGADAKDFITRLLREDPRQRLTAAACLGHPFLNPEIPFGAEATALDDCESSHY